MGVDKVIGALVPPSDDSGVRRWRWIMAVTVTLIVMWIWWAMGVFSAVGVPGLARAGETKVLSERLSSIEKKQDIATKLALSQEICRIYFLRMTASGPLLTQLNQSFNEKQQQYMAIDGARYPVVECTPPAGS